ncbi:pgsA [Symbiodinium pilosum]|uniref:PgsA protein n=1 Tax=Symbiodinium pilosum TaxID=2952 RepID=A0A812KM90_SYMPI|nr:pgsA [Symbiodinium pilosum]
MEVRVEAAKGLPANAVLSLRLGGTRRQAPLESALLHALRFSTLLEDASEPLRLDVLRPISTARIVLRSQETQYTVPLEGSADGAVRISVKPSLVKAAGTGKGTDANKAPGMPGFKDAAASAKEYLERHQLLPYMQSLLHAVIQAKPEDPFAYMVEQLTSAHTCSEAQRPFEEAPEVHSDPGQAAAGIRTPVPQAASDPGAAPVETRVPSPQDQVASTGTEDSAKSSSFAVEDSQQPAALGPRLDSAGMSHPAPLLSPERPTRPEKPAAAHPARARDPKRLEQVRANLQKQLQHAIADGKLETSVQRAMEMMMSPTEAEDRLRNELTILHTERTELISRAQRLMDELQQLRTVNDDLHLKLSKCNDYGRGSQWNGAWPLAPLHKVNIWTKLRPVDLIDKAPELKYTEATGHLEASLDCRSLAAQAGLGWTSTLFMVAAAGVILSLSQEMQGIGEASLFSFVLLASGAFICGACLVLCSVGTTHLREFIGPLNAGAWSAFVASLGNIAIWVAVELSEYAHFQEDSSTSTFLMWTAVGSASCWNVIVVTFVPARIGFARTFCLIVAGKVTGGLFVDAAGILLPRRQITPARGIGGLLVVAAALAQKLGSTEASHGHGAYDVVASTAKDKVPTKHPHETDCAKQFVPAHV